MSYSHVSSQPSKAAVTTDLMAKFDSLTVPQFPIHSQDRAAVLVNLQNALNILPIDAAITASISGYISLVGGKIVSISMSACASYTQSGDM